MIGSGKILHTRFQIANGHGFGPFVERIGFAARTHNESAFQLQVEILCLVSALSLPCARQRIALPASSCHAGAGPAAIPRDRSESALQFARAIRAGLAHPLRDPCPSLVQLRLLGGMLKLQCIRNRLPVCSGSRFGRVTPCAPKQSRETKQRNQQTGMSALRTMGQRSRSSKRCRRLRF